MWARHPRNLRATPFISDVMRDKSDRPDATSRVVAIVMYTKQTLQNDAANSLQ